jgi:hypothetical protein
LTKLLVTFARGAAIEINMERMADWRKTEMPEFAAGWANQLAPAVHLGINYATGTVAQSLMAGTLWSNVPSTLRRDPKDAIRILANDDSAANSSMIRLLGLRTRVYEWESVPTAPDTPAMRQLLVAVGDDNQAYLFTLEGPAQQVKDLQDKFESVVSSFDPAK